MNPVKLPILTNPPESCEGCGLCCMHMAVPPFVDEEERVRLVPPSIREELYKIYETRKMQFKMFGTDAIPCAWFNPVSRSCLYYEYRPDICREFELGNPSCLEFRAELGDKPTSQTQKNTH